MSASPGLDETHDPAALSWVESANDPAKPFPLQNLPFGSFRPAGGDWRLGVAIGERVFDLRAGIAAGLFSELDAETAAAASAARLNPLLGLPRAASTRLRRALFVLLRQEAPEALRQAAAGCLHAVAEVELRVPMTVGDYTDFFASIHHARRTARLLRGANDVAANYRWLPIGYHGRASSIVASGHPVVRPQGQFLPPGDTVPSFGPTRRLDFELEMAAVIGRGNTLGTPIPIGDAEASVFGLCLMNDWSARDIQAFEYQPLGPFLGKNFCTTLSPWVVTLDALAPFRQPLEAHAADDPAPMAHLVEPHPERAGFAIALTVGLRTAAMRDAGQPPARISASHLSHLYWSFGQMVTHHASNGCNLVGGDVLGSGTISGPTPGSAGCLLELTEAGAAPISLPNGETRTYLEDGDEIILDGVAEAAGFRSIGFGSCAGMVVAGR